MSIENDQPAMTRPLSDALMDALSRWTHPIYNDPEDAA